VTGSSQRAVPHVVLSRDKIVAMSSAARSRDDPGKVGLDQRAGDAADHVRGAHVASASPPRVGPEARHLQGERTWSLVDEWVERAGDAGERSGFADLLIGALAAEREAVIRSLDTDFARMMRLKLLARHGSP
jgi:predicted nucleic acid-binding protein